MVAIPETYLGLRHGPMSFLRADTLVLCWLSNDPVRRRYEEDLLLELRAKKLGRIVCIGTPLAGPELADTRIAASAPGLPDALRAPFEIVFAQLLAYHLSLHAGLRSGQSQSRRRDHTRGAGSTHPWLTSTALWPAKPMSICWSTA